MSKRFTDVNKWRDPWFVDLPPMAKLLWIFLCDNCDAAGVWQIHVGLCRAAIGCDIDLGEIRANLGDRVAVLDGGKKWHLTKFVRFQYPRGLSPKVPAQLGVIRLLQSHGMPIPYAEAFMGCQSHKDTDTDKDQDPPSSISNARATPPVEALPISQTKPGIVELNTIPGLKLTAESRPAWLALAAEVGLAVIREARDEIVATGGACWQADVATVALRIKTRRAAAARGAAAAARQDDEAAKQAARVAEYRRGVIAKAQALLKELDASGRLIDPSHELQQVLKQLRACLLHGERADPTKLLESLRSELHRHDGLQESA